MANCLFLFNAPTDTAVIGGAGSWQASLPATNVQKPQPTEVARTTGITTGNTQIQFDFGVARTVQAFAIIAHNISAAGTARIVTSNDATFATNTGASAYTSVRPAAAANLEKPWEGFDATAYPGGHSFLHVHTAPLTGRYLRVQIVDTANPDGYVQIGRFMAASPFIPKFNFSYGASVRIIDPSTVSESVGGQEWFDKRPKRRAMTLSYDALSKEEALGAFYDLQAKIGITGNLLFCADPDEPDNYRPRRTLYCRPESPEPIVEANPSITAPFTASVSLVELL